jgi:hypothetical protein
MKITDDYEAKLALWAKECRVVPLPRADGIPKFSSRKFSSWEAFNAWKRQLRDQIAAQGGLRWTR